MASKCSDEISPKPSSPRSVVALVVWRASSLTEPWTDCVPPVIYVVPFFPLDWICSVAKYQRYDAFEPFSNVALAFTRRDELARTRKTPKPWCNHVGPLPDNFDPNRY